MGTSLESIMCNFVDMFFKKKPPWEPHDGILVYRESILVYRQIKHFTSLSRFLAIALVVLVLEVHFRVEVDARQAGSQLAMESYLPLLHQSVLDDGKQIHDAQVLRPVNHCRPQPLSRHRRPNMRMIACGRLR